MIKHIVIWRLQDEAGGRTKEENFAEMKRRLEALPGAIPQLLHAEVGFNFSKSDRAFDVALYSHFATKEDLAVYVTHPAHLEVVDFIRSISLEVNSVDYEI